MTDVARLNNQHQQLVEKEISSAGRTGNVSKGSWHSSNAQTRFTQFVYTEKLCELRKVNEKISIHKVLKQKDTQNYGAMTSFCD